MQLKEAAVEFNTSTFTISYWLKKMGFRYKKNNLHPWKGKKKIERDT